MKKTLLYGMMAAALAMVSCVKTEMKPLDPQNPIFPVANVVEMTTLTSSEATKDEDGRRIFTLDLTDGATPMHLTLVGSKYYLTANQYTEALEAVAKNGNFVLGKSSIAGKNIKQGYINVDVLEEVETEEGCDNAYKISAVLFLEDGTPYKANWTGRISFEKDPILGPQFHYTDTVAQDCTDAGGTLYTDVESHTLVLNDLEGNFAAQIKLIRSVGAKDLSGEYTVAEYAHEDFTAGNGFDMTPYGWPVVIGSYYLDADGNNVIIEPGAKITVTKAGEGGFYSIDGDGFSFLCAPEGYIPGILIYDSVDTVAQDCTDAGGTLYEDVESHTIVLTDAADATVAQIKLIRAVGTTDLTGVYTVAEYAHEDFTAGNGFDMTPYGWPVVIGTYYYDEEGNVVIVEPGETITVTSAGQDTYKFEGSTGWTFVAMVEVPTPQPGPGGDDPVEAALTDFLSLTDYSGWGVNLLGVELGTTGFTYTPATWTTPAEYPVDGAYIKLEVYSENGTVAAGTYTPSADPNALVAGEFKTGSQNGGTTLFVVKDGSATPYYVADGTVTVAKEGDVYTIAVTSTTVTATYVGKLSAEAAAAITIDGDPSDWVGVENVVTLELPDGAELTALQSAKVLYSDKIYILAQLSDEALADGKIRLHVYFDTDETGKAQQKWVDADIDYMLEGKMTNSGAFVPYSSSFYKWNGTEPGDWAWTDSGTELGLEGAGADHYYELAIDYTNYPGGLPEQFPIGLDVVYTDWNIHGYLPQTNHKLVIKKDGIAPQPSDEPAGITIDGDMSDWADIQGAVNEEGAAYAEFKVTSDANNIYFYARRTSTKFADLWNGGGYLYFAFDTDNDATTGTGEIWGNGPYECIFVIWPFAGSSAEPAFAASPLGESQMKPSGKLDNYIADGVFDSATGVELEFSIPRADMPALPETEISIFSWGNKSGESMKNVPLKVTL